MMRIHCLEGRRADGTRVFSCGREGHPLPSNHVGIAAVKTLSGDWQRVDCKSCQRVLERRYGIKLTAS